MDGARIQILVDKGYRIAAKNIGLPFNIFRPTTAFNPLDHTNFIIKTPAAFAVNEKFKEAREFGKSNWIAYIDPALIQPYDYVVENTAIANQLPRTFYISSKQPLLPNVAIQCNMTINIMRPYSSMSIGAVGYGGDVSTQELTIMTGFPVSMLQGPKGEKSETGLVGDVRLPWYLIFMPYIEGVRILTNDVIIDQHQNRYKISSTELTPLGWRLNADYSEA